MRGKRSMVAVCAAAVCVGLALTPARAVTRVVEVRSNAYDPAFITIRQDDTVRWVVSNGSHTVTASSDTRDRGEIFDSSDNCRGAIVFGDCLRSGDTYTHTFTHRGTFTYFCERHGSDAVYPNCGMCARVRVLAPTATTSPSPTATGSVSPTTSPTGTASPTTTGSPTGSLSPGSSPRASGPGDDGAAPVVAIAAVAVGVLGLSGFFVWRSMIRR